MDWRRVAIRCVTGPVFLAVLARAEAGEAVVLRAGDGRFLRAAEDGSVRPGPWLPGEEETFELVPGEGDEVAIKAHHGRFLPADGREGTRLRPDCDGIDPGVRVEFALVPVGGNRVALKAHDGGGFVDFLDHDAKGPGAEAQDKPGPEETVEIFCVLQVPSLVCSGLALAIRGLVAEELADEEYDKVRKQRTRKYVELPAPTLRDLSRRKKHRVLSVTEEYHLKARLDAAPDVRISGMAYLKGYFEPGSGLLLFDAEARVPVAGRVRYKIPDVVSASTGYHTVVELSMMGEVRAEKSGDRLSLSPPELMDLRVKMHGLDLSNDVLHVVRRKIEDLANRELRRKKDEILRKANKTIARAVDATEFRHPLLEHLALP